MQKELSILLPSYNNVCDELVKTLQHQCEECEASCGLRYEIIVADDGSTDTSSVEQNKIINTIPHCRYIIRERNEGRAAIRNFLARQARYDRLLFIDSDLMVRHCGYIRRYIESSGSDVVYGGYVIHCDLGSMSSNLRFIYDSSNTRNGNATERNKKPYSDFHTSNFVISRNVMLRFPLDERFRRYGYEDVLLGKTLKENRISIRHIDNPLSFENFDSNHAFVAKTEEGIQTLHDFEDELRGYSSVIAAGEKIKRLGLLPMADMAYRQFVHKIKRKLTGNEPTVFLFNMYKLLLFCHLKAEDIQKDNNKYQTQ